MLLPPGEARSLGALFSVGLAFVLAIVMGVAAGLWLDTRLGTSPWLLLVFLGCGFAAGVLNIVRATKRL